jgi:F-type H+-transporting ATPase subunit epsilon
MVLHGSRRIKREERLTHVKFQLVTLAGTQLDEEVYEVMLPTADGPISVFDAHEPLVSIAIPGAIAVRLKKGDAESKLEYYAIGGGVIEVTSHSVKVLVDEADYGDDIVEAESKAALERALKMKETAKNQVELEKATQLIDRHQVRLNVAGLRRKHRR